MPFAREDETLKGILVNLYHWKKQLRKTNYIYGNNINPLTSNDPCNGRTAPLNSKRCILYIYSINIDTEYFKHGIHVYSPFFIFKMQFVS